MHGLGVRRFALAQGSADLRPMSTVGPWERHIPVAIDARAEDVERLAGLGARVGQRRSLSAEYMTRSRVVEHE